MSDEKELALVNAEVLTAEEKRWDDKGGPKQQGNAHRE